MCPPTPGPHWSIAPLALGVPSPLITHLQSGPHGAVSVSSWYVEWESRAGNEGVWGESLPWDCIALWFLTSCLSGKFLFHLPGSIRRGLNPLHMPCPLCPDPLCPLVLLPTSSVSAGQLL